MERRSSTKDYADALEGAVNSRALKSMERKELAPREEHISEHGFGEPEKLQTLRAVNQGEQLGAGLSL